MAHAAIRSVGSILAVEAVTRSASVARVDADGCDEVQLGPGESPAQLVPSMTDRSDGVDALAIAIGPGSFTGLRMSAVAVKTLAWLRDLPIHPVPTLAAIAAAAGDGLWWVAFPLKRDVTFHAVYAVESGQVRECCAPFAMADAAADDASMPTDAVVIGPAVDDKPALMTQLAGEREIRSGIGCSAAVVARIAAQFAACSWRVLDVDYRMASAPELQRNQRDGVA